MANPSYTIIPGLNDQPGGRPSKIDQPYDLRDDGTPRSISEAIIDHVRDGAFLETATSLVGIPAKTVREWLYAAARTEAALTTEPTQTEQNYLNFRTAYLTALAEAENAEWRQHAEVAAGGRRIRTTTLRRKHTPEHPDGIVVASDVVEKVLPPEARALEWRMEKRNPRRFSQKIQVAQVDEFALSPEDERDAIADKLSAFLQGRDEGIAEARAETEPTS